jgi:SAM-dependent methyltransferase
MTPTTANAAASKHYDADYFKWQHDIGKFGGWANSKVFGPSIKPNDTVVDFGCGGGSLLHNLVCKERIGIEPNPSAAASVKSLGIRHFFSPEEALKVLGPGVVDVIISTHALEHALNPFLELNNLRLLLKSGGRVHFIVPCDSIRQRYNSQDINNHLYSWNPQNLGNIFREAGFHVSSVKSLKHRWPPFYTKVARLGWPVFNFVCHLYGHLDTSSYQVELKGTLP